LVVAGVWVAVKFGPSRDDLAVPRRKVFVHLDGNARGEFGDRGIFAAAASEGRGIYVLAGQRLGVFDSGSLLAFACIAIPLGVKLRFIAFDVQWAHWKTSRR